jgi:hypothetical protein
LNVERVPGLSFSSPRAAAAAATLAVLDAAALAELSRWW